MRIRSRGARHPGLADNVSLEKSEGAGNAGRPSRPQPRVVVENTRVSHHGHAGSPGIPRAIGFNGFLRALPGDRLFCHRRVC
jgi:hypothetical protein